MKKIEIIGYKRANLGKSETKHLRLEGNVPCVLYGGKEQIHFYAPMILFRDLVYTQDAAFVDLNIEGEHHDAILQDVQFHPVSEMLLHADFLLLDEDKKIKMDIPLKFIGNPPGVLKGGKLMVKLRNVKLKAFPQDIPEHINIDVSGLDLGKSVKIGNIQTENYTILNSSRVTIATVDIPRVLKSLEEEEAAKEAEELEEAEETETSTSEE